MSKKLLMNNYSENGLMPVMNGLICWLDGRDGSGTDTVWRDRCNNGNDASMTCNFNPLYHEWDGKKFIVKQDTTNFKTGFKNKLYGYKTLEFTFMIKAEKTYPYIFSSPRRNIRMCLHGSNVIQYTLANNGILSYIDSDFNLGIQYTITITISNNLTLYVNGIKHTQRDDHTGTPEDGPFYIFCDQYASDLSARQLVGHYCSFKAYNRALTEEEIQQNYEYEQSIERG